jgi:release factor glutamine methyltransferase
MTNQGHATTENASTISQVLAWSTERLRTASPTPRLDAELLLAHALGWSRARVLAEGRQQLAPEQLAGFYALVDRRVALEPVAYLVGHKEFYGLDFVVDRRVLVPRPETELLVELAINRTKNQEPRTKNHLSARFSVLGSRFSIVDVGTGSGCIAVALAVHLPQAQITAIDISPDTLAVARENAERHQVAGRVRLVRGDLLAPLDSPVDIIVSNPPYTVLSEIDEGVRRHEPAGALDGGPDGLDLYRRLLAQAPQKLRPGGAMLLEIGDTQGQAVAEIARRSFPDAQIEVHQDLAGLDRVVTIDETKTRGTRQGDTETRDQISSLWSPASCLLVSALNNTTYALRIRGRQRLPRIPLFGWSRPHSWP